jgi:hypothetical protein
MPDCIMCDKDDNCVDCSGEKFAWAGTCEKCLDSEWRKPATPGCQACYQNCAVCEYDEDLEDAKCSECVEGTRMLAGEERMCFSKDGSDIDKSFLEYTFFSIISEGEDLEEFEYELEEIKDIENASELYCVKDMDDTSPYDFISILTALHFVRTESYLMSFICREYTYFEESIHLWKDLGVMLSMSRSELLTELNEDNEIVAIEDA